MAVEPHEKLINQEEKENPWRDEKCSSKRN